MIEIADLCLTKRAETMLASAGIAALEDLCRLPACVILAHPNCGRGTLKDIEVSLARIGMSLPREYPPSDFAEDVLERFRNLARLQMEDK